MARIFAEKGGEGENQVLLRKKVYRLFGINYWYHVARGNLGDRKTGSEIGRSRYATYTCPDCTAQTDRT